MRKTRVNGRAIPPETRVKLGKAHCAKGKEENAKGESPGENEPAKAVDRKPHKKRPSKYMGNL